MKKILKRGMSGLLAVLMAFTVLAGFGTTTAFAASETAESYMISFPRDGDAAQIYSEDAWGHSAKTYMNGWTTGSSNYTTLHCMDSFDGKVCYCIEPGLSRNVGDTYHGFGEDFWDNYPSQYNNTIEPDDIKLLLGRIMQYGYQGNLSTSWRSQNDSDADKLAHAFATQLLVWETVVGERDADFDHVSTGGYDEILSLVSPNHPLYSRIMDYYDSIESSVQSHAVCPSFMSRSSGGAKTIELAWDGSQYIAELTDTNHVLSQFTFSASETGFHFSVSGNTLTITTDTAPTGNVTISASRSASRCGVLVWTDYKYGPNGGVQDTITYTASVSDPVRAFLKLKVSYGGAKIIKTSEDGRVDGITFTITGEGVNQTVTTDRNGEIRIDNLMPGVYTVTEQSYDKYVPQESHRVTVLAGKTATVSFNNVLRRGDLTVTKTSEDGLNQGVKFHLFGTSLSGLPVDEFAVTGENGVATFKDVLIGTGYTLEEMDAAIRYVIPDSQSAAVEWNKNLAAFTKMRNVGNISQTEAMKSSDLYMKCRYLDQLTGGRGVVFATGTPISNSMVEMYTMQKYLQYGALRRNDLLHFDAWASTFGETVTAIELSPEGTGYRAKTRFAKFYNLPELMAMFKETADIQTADMLKLPVPEAHYHSVVLKPSETQKEMVASLSERAERVRNKMVDSSVDNMLLITNDGRKLALDQRLMNDMLPDSETSKVGACAENVFDIWQRTADRKSTQMVFCDLSTPHGDGKFNVYDDLRNKLIAKGVPAEEIAYIHTANSEAQKKELFGKVRSGQVRVLIGSTQKMGAGTNVQTKLAALHHLDCRATRS